MNPVKPHLYELVHSEAQQYGGMCRSIGGDGVLIVFGAPVAQEDHAQRAVCAALGIQRQLARWQDGREASGTEALEIRLGLHTGRAAVEASGTSHEMGAVVVGEIVTQAVALQERAESGTILCSEATAHLVQREVRLQALPLMAMDGPSTLGTIYKILGQRARRPPAVPHIARGRMPFVGRARELATLHDVWAQVTKGQGHVVSVVGESGMGKSREYRKYKATFHAHTPGTHPPEPPSTPPAPTSRHRELPQLAGAGRRTAAAAPAGWWWGTGSRRS